MTGRPKEFDEREALDAAMEVFREHGFDGSSAGMLIDSMKISRQSLYDTFGDKWHLYLSALRRYCSLEVESHLVALKAERNAIDGIRAVLERVVRDARRGCLGVSSICEFGGRKPELRKIQAEAERSLRGALVKRIVEAQAAGDVSAELDAASVMDFLVASFAGIRIAARGGAKDAQLQALSQMALRALR